MKLTYISLSIFFFLIPFFFKVNQAASQTSETATDSSNLDYDLIKENVKKRIQEVVKDKASNLTKEKASYIGTLKSIAGNTLSIETNQAIKLASVSAQTSFVRLPNLTKATIDDLSLEDYVAALGYLEPGEVLNTRQLIIHRSPLSPSTYQTAFGQIESYDPKKYLLVITNPKNNQPTTVVISRKAIVRTTTQDSDLPQDISRTDSLPAGAQTVIIYLPPETNDDDAVAYHVLVKLESPAAPPVGTL